MSASSAASSISSLVMQLQHIESTIAGICLEVGLSVSLSLPLFHHKTSFSLLLCQVVLKLSSLTDSDIFLVVEDAGRRSWMGRRRFREVGL